MVRKWRPFLLASRTVKDAPPIAKAKCFWLCAPIAASKGSLCGFVDFVCFATIAISTNLRKTHGFPQLSGWHGYGFAPNKP